MAEGNYVLYNDLVNVLDFFKDTETGKPLTKPAAAAKLMGTI